MVSFQRVKKWLGKKSSLHTMHVLFLGKKFAKGIKKVAKSQGNSEFFWFIVFSNLLPCVVPNYFLLLFGGSFSVHLCFWSLVQHWSVKLLSRVWLFAIPWTGAYQAPPSMEFFRQGIFQKEMGCHFLLQGIFPTRGSNSGLMHCRQTLDRLSYQGSWIDDN